MSFFKGLVGMVSSLFKTPKPPPIPKAQIPATPAGVPQTTAGANIVIGTPTDTTRVSGSGTSKKKVDPLGLLGLGGLSI